MGYLNTFDYAVIAIYFTILVGLGFYLSRKAAASLEDYFLGGKKLPWWALGISGMASFLDITGTMLITSFLFLIGPRGLFIEFRGGAVLILAFMLVWTGKWHRRSNCMTAAEWNIYRFGAGPGGQFARVLGALAQTIFTIGMLAYMITGVGPFLATYINLSPFYCAVLLLTIATIYTMVSGFYGVVYTDMFQSVIILVAVVGISIAAFTSISSHEESVGTLAESITGVENWTTGAPSTHVDMPAGYEDYSPLALLAFFYLFRNVLGGVASGGDPKYFGARNERQCGLLTFMWTCLMTFRWPMMMGFAVLGLFMVKDRFSDPQVLKDAETAIKTYLVQQERPGYELDFATESKVEAVLRKVGWPKQVSDVEPAVAKELQSVLGPDWQTEFQRLIDQHAFVARIVPKTAWREKVGAIIANPEDHEPIVAQLKALFGEEWGAEAKLVGYEGGVDPERILPSVLLFSIPVGFRGLLIIALIAASMSTFDSTVNMTTGFFTRDIYQPYINPNAGNRELIIASYVFGVVLVVLSLLLARTVENITEIWDWVIMGLTSALAVPGILRLYWWRFNASGVVVATIVGMSAPLAQRGLATAGIEFFDWNAITQFCVLTPLTFVAAIIGALLTPPTNPRILEHFYRTTRPFGFWGPLKAKLEPELRANVTKEHRNDMLALPFALGWQVTMFLLPMLVIVNNLEGAAATGAIFLVCLGGMYIFWYRNLPPEDDGPDTDPYAAVREVTPLFRLPTATLPEPGTPE